MSWKNTISQVPWNPDYTILWTFLQQEFAVKNLLSSIRRGIFVVLAVSWPSKLFDFDEWIFNVLLSKFFADRNPTEISGASINFAIIKNVARYYRLYAAPRILMILKSIEKHYWKSIDFQRENQTDAVNIWELGQF